MRQLITSKQSTSLHANQKLYKKWTRKKEASKIYPKKENQTNRSSLASIDLLLENIINFFYGFSFSLVAENKYCLTLNLYFLTPLSPNSGPIEGLKLIF